MDKTLKKPLIFFIILILLVFFLLSCTTDKKPEEIKPSIQSVIEGFKGLGGFKLP